MYSLWRSQPQTKEKPVKLNVVNAIELKQDANYILVADSRHVTDKDMLDIIKQCKKYGVNNVVAFLMNGGGKSAVQLIDRPKPRRTTKKEKR